MNSCFFQLRTSFLGFLLNYSCSFLRLGYSASSLVFSGFLFTSGFFKRNSEVFALGFCLEFSATYLFKRNSGVFALGFCLEFSASYLLVVSFVCLFTSIFKFLHNFCCILGRLGFLSAIHNLSSRARSPLSVGKTTVAVALEERLKAAGLLGRQISMLDGDVVRQLVSSGLGFSKEDRELNIKRIGYVWCLSTKRGGGQRAQHQERRVRVTFYLARGWTESSTSRA